MSPPPAPTREYDGVESRRARDPLFLHHHRQDADFRMTGLPVIGRMSPNAKTASLAALMALAMTGLGFAAVPLYDLFCRVTGFGGTTQRYDPVAAAAEPQIQIGRASCRERVCQYV